jgi:hypothetical protein
MIRDQSGYMAALWGTVVCAQLAICPPALAKPRSAKSSNRAANGGTPAHDVVNDSARSAGSEAVAPAQAEPSAEAPTAQGGADVAAPAAPESGPASPEPSPKAAVSARATGAPAAAVTSAAESEQLASLQSDVTQLIDDMVQARARAALLGKTLFKTRLRLNVQNLAAPEPVLVRVVLTLDGAPVFRGDGTALRGDDPRQVFEGFVSPGPHVLTVELEQRSQRDGTYGYTLHDSYRFQALREHESDLTLVVDDDSNLASDFADDAKGEYDVRVKLRVRTRESGQGQP